AHCWCLDVLLRLGGSLLLPCPAPRHPRILCPSWIAFSLKDVTSTLHLPASPCGSISEPKGRGNLDGCIHRAAGPLLKEECRALNGCETGKAKISCGYRLPAKFIIHTVGPIAQGEPSATQKEELGNCYKNSLKLAVENKLRTVAFPCISTGVFGYPNDAAAEVVLNTLHLWLEDNKEKVDRIIICVFLEKDDEIYKEKLPRFFPIA
uniref:Mono-ADP ribosylhydrolase 1 n=1 Tax=Anolis carolinensis TaxID=28377 RepID=H9GJ01_ANOCA